MIINHNTYISRNGVYTTPDKIVYDDFIVDPISNQSVNALDISITKKAVKLSTPLQDFYYNSRDEVLINLELKRISNVQKCDYLCIPYSYIEKGLPLKSFKISQYLINKKYDVSVISDDLCKTIGVRASFLKKALTTGVPDQEFFNHNFSEFLRNNSYYDAESYKADFIADHVRELRSSLPINLGFLKLATIVLTNRFSIKNSLLTFLDDVDNEVIRYLESTNINFQIIDNLVVCNSQLLINLFECEFENFDFVNLLTNKLRQYMLDFLKHEHFITGSLKTLRILQDFYFSLGMPACIEFFDQNSYILSEISNCIVTSEMIYLPVLSVNEVDDSFIEII